jgi:hypothetical protein
VFSIPVPSSRRMVPTGYTFVLPEAKYLVYYSTDGGALRHHAVGCTSSHATYSRGGALLQRAVRYQGHPPFWKPHPTHLFVPVS